MASNSGSPPEGTPFDIAKIRQLVRMMKENDLSEVDLRWDDSRVRLRRGPDNVVVSSGMMPAVPQALAPAAAAAPSSTEPAKPEKPEESGTLITSPMVGTFYASSSPDADPFVSVGAKVTKDSTVCIIEAMKVFNEIPAGVGGTIAEILVENGAAVEFGQPLFRVST
ncbi:Acetyl-CoA biotin carboxyl carrier [Planctomycetes bacterium Pan216]|uniref:Biotin carboxyl carrier protein of acetyl-CoA carboxylase n=1 Tax=Kolteria novifilia TaxID=2527975 RepID=A0A518B069_9BACT|nr:Acetyl-CoA biotin carboxyl carrier [Planctomycetes bacterium Pan216]